MRAPASRRLPARAAAGEPAPGRCSRSLVAAVVAVGGAAAAIALTRDTATATTIVTATGGSETVAGADRRRRAALADWPAGTSGWTNILVSVPKVDGRDAAVARAEQARGKGLRRVGVLDSSRYASLHPGYWVVFAGRLPERAGGDEPPARGARRATRSPHRARQPLNPVASKGNFEAEFVTTNANRVDSVHNRVEYRPIIRLQTAFSRE